MVWEGERMFDAVSRFRQLNIMERLQLFPRSELVTIKAIADASEGGNRRASVTEIARRLNVSPPAISRKVKILREKEYVETIIDENDRRNTYLTLTPKGQAALQENFNKVTTFLDHVLNRLDPGDLDHFYHLFDKIFLAMEQELDHQAARNKPETSHSERSDRPNV